MYVSASRLLGVSEHIVSDRCLRGRWMARAGWLNERGASQATCARKEKAPECKDTMDISVPSWVALGRVHELGDM